MKRRKIYETLTSIICLQRMANFGFTYCSEKLTIYIKSISAKALKKRYNKTLKIFLFFIVLMFVIQRFLIILILFLLLQI